MNIFGMQNGLLDGLFDCKPRSKLHPGVVDGCWAEEGSEREGAGEASAMQKASMRSTKRHRGPQCAAMMGRA